MTNFERIKQMSLVEFMRWYYENACNLQISDEKKVVEC